MNDFSICLLIVFSARTLLLKHPRPRPLLQRLLRLRPRHLRRKRYVYPRLSCAAFLTHVSQKEEKAKSPKVGRRLSARVGDFFKPKAKAEPTTPKVEENPPKLAESEPIAPLENPAAETAAESAPAPAATEEPKAEAPPAAPVVAAAA